MNRTLDVTLSVMSTALRLGAGYKVGPLGPRPDKPLELYEFEACPYCRRVREALSFLDLEAMIFPCPKRGSRFRERAKELGGKAQFPLLVDPNTETVMYDSAGIVKYLVMRYGAGKSPGSLGPLSLLSLSLASAPRLRKGEHRRASRAPEKPLELYSFEPSPYCRIAREALCELELPYLLHNVAKGSPRREAFVARSGKMMVPYLVDPNTGKEMFESAEIVRYLEETYAL
jgi:glutathione S-transferase